MNEPVDSRNTTSPGFSRMSRRDVLKGAAVLAGASMIGCEGVGTGPSAAGLAVGASTARRRIAVIGGGAGGITAAWFLGPHHDIELFESRDKAGGHADSRPVTFQGQQIATDLGAQFFHPDTHPLYVSILEELGLFNPDAPDADQTLEAPGSICIFPKNGFLPTFSSRHVWLTPFYAIDFLIYSQFARALILENQSWETTLETWINNLPVSGGFKTNILFPWISATIGTNQTDAKRSSARSILQTFALAFPSNIFKGASTYNSRIGLGGNLQKLLEKCQSTQVRLNAAVNGLAYADGKWTVKTAGGSFGPFDNVVLNAPPTVTKHWLAGVPEAAAAVPLLDKYQYFDARMVIHSDPKYVHKNREFWAAYNAMTDGAACEGSVWYGAMHPKNSAGKTIDIWKSWAFRRSSDPANIIHERKFRHPLITPESIRAGRSLKAHQGRNGLFFAGQYTTGFDLQESATYSAMKVAEALAPSSPTLAALKARMVKRGRGNPNYDL